MTLSSLWTRSAPKDSPIPGHLALATSDLDHAREHLSTVFADHRLIPDGRTRSVNFRHSYAPLGAVSFNGLQYGAAVTVSAPALTDFYLLQFTLRGTCEIDCGASSVILAPGSILVMNPTRPYRKHWSADCRQLLVRIDKTLLRRQLAALLGHDAEQSLEFEFASLDGRRRGATLARFAELICRDLEGDRLLTRPETQRSAAETLCHLLLDTIDHSYRDALDRPAELPVPRFVRRAEEFIRANVTADIALDEIARAAGVSERTLHRGFRSFRDTTPMAHLKSVRLVAARRALLEDRHASITTVATALGLPHLGKFAREYRRRFGELPSQTLRRRSD
jgi:AraC-like DNA-binding protein